jgi:hypothetical protein
MDMDPKGFMTPKRPDNDNKGDLGVVVAGYEGDRAVYHKV